MSQRVLFFSRGRGHGHAIPDMAVAREMLALQPGTSVHFASYATGAETLRNAGWEVIDLHLPADNPWLPTLLACCDVIQRVQPSVIIAHEEFAALVAGRVAGIPSIFISAWLPQSRGYAYDAMACADYAIILEEPGLFVTPTGMGVQPLFVGRLRRPLRYGPADRARARRELSLQDGTVMITVVPGGYASEDKAPIFPVVLDAFQQLPLADKRLFWLGGPDGAKVACAAQGVPGIVVLEHHPDVDQFLAASDLVITKGTRGATLDAAEAGVPSISLSHGLNPVDDLLVPRIRSNLSLNARAVTAPVLAFYAMRLLRSPTVPTVSGGAAVGSTSPGEVAGALLHQMQLFETAKVRDEVDATGRA